MDATMEIDCHNCRVVRKVKRKETSCYIGWLNCLPFLSGDMMINCVVILGLILCLGC